MGWVIKVYCNVERIFDNAAIILRIYQRSMFYLRTVILTFAINYMYA